MHQWSFCRICTNFLFKRWLFLQQSVIGNRCALLPTRILPQPKTTNKKRSIPMLFPQALKMMMLKKFFFQFIFGVFFQSLHPNGCLEARISQAKHSSVAPWHLNRSPSHFWGSSHHFFNFLGWWRGIKKKQSKQKSEHKHNTYHLLESTSLPPSFPQVSPKFQRPQVSKKRSPNSPGHPLHQHPSGGSVGGQEAYLEVIDPNVTWGFARKKKRMGPGDSKWPFWDG